MPRVNNWNISVKTRKTVMLIIDTKTADNNKYVPIIVARHEKTGLMCTKYTYSYYGMYLLYCLRF